MATKKTSGRTTTTRSSAPSRGAVGAGHPGHGGTARGYGLQEGNLAVVARSAVRVNLAFTIDEVARELYDVAEPVLDEAATLRRVALFYRGTGRYLLTPEERDVALGVIRARAEQVHPAR